MRLIFFFLLTVWIFLVGIASAIGQHSKSAPWLTDFETAKTMSQEQDRPILMIFSGSDWCKPCILFRRNVLDTEEFLAYAAENLILLELDFPAKRKNRLGATQTAHNEALAEQFNPKGEFPLAVLLRTPTQLLTSFSYEITRDAQSYIAYIDQQINPAQPKSQP